MVALFSRSLAATLVLTLSVVAGSAKIEIERNIFSPGGFEKPELIVDEDGGKTRMLPENSGDTSLFRAWGPPGQPAKRSP